jgi:hypothetical protein
MTKGKDGAMPLPGTPMVQSHLELMLTDALPAMTLALANTGSNSNLNGVAVSPAMRAAPEKAMLCVERHDGVSTNAGTLRRSLPHRRSYKGIKNRL